MTVDITQLSVAERIQLVEDLWDSIAVKPDTMPVTEAQRDELDRRLTSYHVNPAEGRTWQSVKDAIKRRAHP